MESFSRDDIILYLPWLLPMQLRSNISEVAGALEDRRMPYPEGDIEIIAIRIIDELIHMNFVS